MSEPSDSDGSGRELTHLLAEPFAFALVTWPAVVGLSATWSVKWAVWGKIGLGVWLAVMHLAAYGRGRGAGFGNVMLFTSGVVALACWTYPSPWTLAWLPLILIGLHAAQRTRLRTLETPSPT